MYVIFIKNFPVFVPPKPDREYSHTNSYICAVIAITQDGHRSQLELGPPVNIPTFKESVALGTQRDWGAGNSNELSVKRTECDCRVMDASGGC